MFPFRVYCCLQRCRNFQIRKDVKIQHYNLPCRPRPNHRLIQINFDHKIPDSKYLTLLLLLRCTVLVQYLIIADVMDPKDFSGKLDIYRTNQVLYCRLCFLLRHIVLPTRTTRFFFVHKHRRANRRRQSIL